jgi:hypothetical protein
MSNERVLVDAEAIRAIAGVGKLVGQRIEALSRLRQVLLIDDDIVAEIEHALLGPVSRSAT